VKNSRMYPLDSSSQSQSMSDHKQKLVNDTRSQTFKSFASKNDSSSNKASQPEDSSMKMLPMALMIDVDSDLTQTNGGKLKYGSHSPNFLASSLEMLNSDDVGSTNRHQRNLQEKYGMKPIKSKTAMDIQPMLHKPARDGDAISDSANSRNTFEVSSGDFKSFSAY